MSRIKILNTMRQNGTYQDAISCTYSGDYAGLAYIVNIAIGMPGHSPVKQGLLFDIIDHIKND